MSGLGTIIDTVAIDAGRLIGLHIGRPIRDKHREMLTKACGIPQPSGYEHGACNSFAHRPVSAVEYHQIPGLH